MLASTGLIGAQQMEVMGAPHALQRSLRDDRGSRRVADILFTCNIKPNSKRGHAINLEQPPSPPSERGRSSRSLPHQSSTWQTHLTSQRRYTINRQCKQRWDIRGNNRRQPLVRQPPVGCVNHQHHHATTRKARPHDHCRCLKTQHIALKHVNVETTTPTTKNTRTTNTRFSRAQGCGSHTKGNTALCLWGRRNWEHERYEHETTYDTFRQRAIHHSDAWATRTSKVVWRDQLWCGGATNTTNNVMQI